MGRCDTTNITREDGTLEIAAILMARCESWHIPLVVAAGQQLCHCPWSGNHSQCGRRKQTVPHVRITISGQRIAERYRPPDGAFVSQGRYLNNGNSRQRQAFRTDDRCPVAVFASQLHSSHFVPNHDHSGSAPRLPAQMRTDPLRPEDRLNDDRIKGRARPGVRSRAGGRFPR
jgi:hypothetical protein